MVVILDKRALSDINPQILTSLKELQATPIFLEGTRWRNPGVFKCKPSGFRKEILSRLKMKTVPDLIDDRSHELKITIPIGIISVHFVGPVLKNSIETSIDTCKL